MNIFSMASSLIWKKTPESFRRTKIKTKRIQNHANVSHSHDKKEFRKINKNVPYEHIVGIE